MSYLVFKIGFIFGFFLQSSYLFAQSHPTHIQPILCETIFENNLKNIPVEEINSQNVQPSALIEDLELISAQIRPLNPSGIGGTSVLYPMSGFDAITPLVLFPSATDYILIDNNDVWRRIDQISAEQFGIKIPSKDTNLGWLHHTNIAEGKLLVRLLASLKSVHDAIKINSINLIYDKDIEQHSAIIFFWDPRDQIQKRLYFLSGNAGLAVEGLFVNPSYRPWWLKIILSLKPRNLILKGSMSEWRITYNANNDYRQFYLNPLIQEGGIVVEGASKEVSSSENLNSVTNLPGEKWELTHGDPQFAQPRTEAIITNVPFSYRDQVRITSYTGTNN